MKILMRITLWNEPPFFQRIYCGDFRALREETGSVFCRIKRERERRERREGEKRGEKRERSERERERGETVG